MLEFVNQTITDKKGIRQVADADRVFSDKDHEPYEHIQAAAKWYRSKKIDTQRALIASIYGDNPILVRDNYGDVKMDYGNATNAKYGVPDVNRMTDSYYDVGTGHVYITKFKNVKFGHRPYDIKLSKETRGIINRQLKKARDAGDLANGYRHFLFIQSGDPKRSIGKLGKNSEVDKALRSAEGVKFTLPETKSIGPNVLRSSYVTWRLSRPGVTLDELMCLAHEMKHSFVVQQLVYLSLIHISEPTRPY